MHVVGQHKGDPPELLTTNSLNLKTKFATGRQTLMDKGKVMNVITNSILLVRRIRELQRRRDALVDRQDRLRRSLPEWTFAPLQLVGMSSDEIRTAMSDLTKAEADAGLTQLEQELERLDQEIETLENQLLSTPTGSLDGIQAVLELAIDRFRGQTVADPNDVFYDYGDARILTFLEHAVGDLREILREDHRAAV